MVAALLLVGGAAVVLGLYGLVRYGPKGKHGAKERATMEIQELKLEVREELDRWRAYWGHALNEASRKPTVRGHARRTIFGNYNIRLWH